MSHYLIIDWLLIEKQDGEYEKWDERFRKDCLHLQNRLIQIPGIVIYFLTLSYRPKKEKDKRIF